MPSIYFKLYSESALKLNYFSISSLNKGNSFIFWQINCTFCIICCIKILFLRGLCSSLLFFPFIWLKSWIFKSVSFSYKISWTFLSCFLGISSVSSSIYSTLLFWAKHSIIRSLLVSNSLKSFPIIAKDYLKSSKINYILSKYKIYFFFFNKKITNLVYLYSNLGSFLV